jgi:hypothetical protein
VAVFYDGLDPCQLEGEERAKAATIFGSIDTIPTEARRVCVLVKGRGIGGTRFGAEALALRAATLDLKSAGVDRSELAYVFFGGPKVRHTRAPLRFALSVLKLRGGIVEDESTEGFTLVRPDGYRVRFEAFAASRGGDNVRGVHILGALLTEAAFYYDESGAANGEDIFGAAIPRLLKGGLIVIESSPWLEAGLLHKEFAANWGNPSRAVAALCPTAIMRDDADTLEKIAAEYARDRYAAERELGAQFLGSGANLFFDGITIDAAVDDSLSPRPGMAYGGRGAIGGDFGLVHDSSAFVVVHHDPDGTLVVAEALELKPSKGKPLKLSEVCASASELAKRHRRQHLRVDHHLLDPAREHMRGVGLVAAPGGQAGKVDCFVRARDLFAQGRVRIPGHYRRIAQQLREIVARPTPGGGLSIQSPRRGGAHGDLASALVLALWEAERENRCGDMRAVIVPGRDSTPRRERGDNELRAARLRRWAEGKP